MTTTPNTPPALDAVTIAKAAANLADAARMMAKATADTLTDGRVGGVTRADIATALYLAEQADRIIAEALE